MVFVNMFFFKYHIIFSRCLAIPYRFIWKKLFVTN